MSFPRHKYCRQCHRTRTQFLFFRNSYLLLFRSSSFPTIVQKAQQRLHRADRASSVVHRHWLLNFCFVARQIASCVLPPPRPYVLMVTADTAGLQRGPGPAQSQDYLIPVANEANCQQPCSLPVRKLVSRAPRLRRRVSGDAWMHGVARCRRCCGFPSYPSCGAAI